MKTNKTKPVESWEKELSNDPSVKHYTHDFDKHEQDQNIYFVWKKGKSKLICAITPLSEQDVHQKTLLMCLQMSLQGWKLVKTKVDKNNG